MLINEYITTFNVHHPIIENDAFVDISTRLIGNITIGSKASV